MNLDQIQAHALAVHTRHRQELEDAYQLTAQPGVRVVVVRKPWRVGDVGTVLGVWQQGARMAARIDFNGQVMSVPLDAVARRPDGPDCDTAQIWHTSAFVKLKAGEFLE